MIHSLAGATIVVPDLDVAVAAYRDHLNYTGATPMLLGEEVAASWGAPQAARARAVMLYPESGERRFIRLIEGLPAEDYRPMASLGWTAIEIVVQDLNALAQRLADSAFRIIGPPAVLDFDFTDAISAMQVVGPGGEILYLTQIDDVIPGFDLPEARSPVGQMFIAVLATHGIAEAARFYAEQGGQTGPIIAARIDVLADAYSLARTHRHELATVALGERSLLEIDKFPANATARSVSAIGLPSGIAIVSMHADRPATGSSLIVGAAGEWIELI